MAQTHFGFQTVDEAEKARRVRGVFDSVASRYDVMNDLLSLGLHRAWKAYTVAVANVRPGMRVLDIAGGTGDLARAFAPKVGDQGLVVHTEKFVHLGDLFFQFRGITLGKASHHKDFTLPVAGLLQDSINGFLFGIMNETTGIDDHCIISGSFSVVDHLPPAFFQLLQQNLRIDQVFGAAHGDDIYTFHGFRLRAQR